MRIIKTLFGSVTWAFLLLFAVPVMAILASWNSLPGESFFTLKLGFEEALLIVAKPAYSAEEELHVKYTKRRLEEVERLLAEKRSVLGLAYLEQQIDSTTKIIESAPNPEAQVAASQEYIETLTEVLVALEDQKQEIAESETVDTSIDTEPEPVIDSEPELPFKINKPKKDKEHTAVTLTEEEIVVVTTEITETQDEIVEAIEELEVIAEAAQEEAEVQQGRQESLQRSNESSDREEKEKKEREDRKEKHESDDDDDEGDDHVD